MKVTAKTQTPNIGVWIELERSSDNDRNHRSAAMANAMLERLAIPDQLPLTARFSWNESRKLYDYGGPMGVRSLTDDGEWFDLEHLGRV